MKMRQISDSSGQNSENFSCRRKVKYLFIYYYFFIYSHKGKGHKKCLKPFLKAVCSKRKDFQSSKYERVKDILKINIETEIEGVKEFGFQH